MTAQKADWKLKVIRTAFRVLALLTIDLIVQVVNIQIMNLQKYLAPAIVTLLGMLLVVLLFYFLLEYIEEATSKLLKYVVDLGTTFKYRKTAVMTIIIFLYFCAFFAYYRLWFHKWIGFEDLPGLFSGKLIR